MKAVCIVIVTWNRLEMLKACVEAARRNAKDADVLVVDNASTDGTADWLGEQQGIAVLTLPENTGGAGGFSAGMKWAFDRGYDWMWIMDDDVVPLEGALSVIAENADRADVIQAAKQEVDGGECLFEGLLDPRTMRRRKIPAASVPQCGFVPCNVATFEGLFVSRVAVERIGFPDASFFYGLDDLFYGYRASEATRFIFVPRFVLRKQLDKSRAKICGRRFYSSSPKSRYYHVRNYWKVMRHLRETGKGSWRMYLTYAYEALKALAVTLLENVVISHCSFDVGDDAICMKSGKDKPGRDRGIPTENVVVDDCVVYHGHGGFVCGSEMSGGIKNVQVSNNLYIGTDVGLRFKSTRGRGGVVENIFIRDIYMANIPNEGLLFDLFYGGKGAGEETEEELAARMNAEAPEVSDETPAFRNIVIENVTGRNLKRAIYFNGLPEMKIQNIHTILLCP